VWVAVWAGYQRQVPSALLSALWQSAAGKGGHALLKTRSVFGMKPPFAGHRWIVIAVTGYAAAGAGQIGDNALTDAGLKLDRISELASSHGPRFVAR
jgi:hypothetical protein